MRSLLAIVVLVMTFFAANGQQIPFDLRCDLLPQANAVYKNGIPDPISIEEAVKRKDVYQFAKIVSKKPLLSWKVDTAQKHITAYRILVASSRQMLDLNNGDCWDSKKVVSKYNKAQYNGNPLKTGAVYHWKVQIWNERNLQLPFSETASFVLSEKDSTDSFSHQPLRAEFQQAEYIRQLGNGHYFWDFGKDALSQLQLRLSSLRSDTIWIEVGELSD